ncbi:MAG: ThuA domain-containing protein [Phycisphaerae bacterium]
MRKRLTHPILLAVAAGMLLAIAGAIRPSAEAAGADKPVKAVVLTGGHGFQEKPFVAMFDAMEGLEATHVALKDHSEIFEDVSGWPYDTIVLYNMTQHISEKRRKNFLSLLDKGVGLVVLHHAMAAWQGWPEFREIVGGQFLLKPTTIDGVKYKKSGWKHGVDYTVHVADPKHPVTRGVKDFEIHDETYCRYWVSPKAHVILTTDEKTSDEAIGWTRTYKGAKVCYLINGHDGKAYANPSYRRLVAGAIRWTAGAME